MLLAAQKDLTSKKTALKSQLVSAGLFFFNDDDKQCGLHFSCRSHALLKAESLSDY